MVHYQILAAGLLSLPLAVSADQHLKRQGNYPFRNGTDSSTILKSASQSPSISSVSSISSSSLSSTSSSSTTYSIRFTYAPQSRSDSASPASYILSPEPVETGSTNSFKSTSSTLAVSHSIGTSHSSVSQQHLSGAESASHSSKSQGNPSAASTAHSSKSQEHLSGSAASSHSSKPPKHLNASASRSISGHPSLITGSSHGTAGCGGRTVNVASASLDWWYDRNIYDVVSVLSYQHDSAYQVTGWTIIPGPTKFTLSMAISDWTCASTKVATTNTFIHSTYSAYPCTTTPVHKAAATTAIFQTGYNTDLPVTGTGFDDVPGIVSMPSPAAFTFGRKTISRGVPFVQINGYEVTSRMSVRGTGGVSCSAVTKTHNLTTPYVFTYKGQNPSIAADHDLAITGKLDDHFLSAIKETAVAGSFTAVPTVVLVVEEVFAATVPMRWFPGNVAPSSTAVYTYYTGARTGSIAAAFTTPAPSALATVAGATALIIEVSAASLDTPSANQLPENAHSTTITDQGFNLYTALVGTPKVQPSDQVLLIPTTNHGTTGTLLSAVQTPTSPADVSAQNGGTNNGSPNNGGSVNIQSNGGGSNGGSSGGESNGGSNGGGSNGGGSNGGGNGGNGGSGSDSPANALQVLNQAMGSAIMAGIGSNSPAATITVLGNVATQTNARAVVVGGQTVVPGSTITVGGTVISMPASGSVVVGGQTTQVPTGSGQVFTVNGATLTATSVEAFPIAGQTLAAGGSPITISNQQVSLNAAGNVLVVGSSTSIIGQAKMISLNGQTFVENSQTQFVLGSGQTLTPGGTAVIGGITVSFDKGGSAIVVAGKTTPVAVAANPTAAADAMTARPAITVDGQTYSPSAGKYVISGQTLSAGGAITFNGPSGKETVSLDKSGTVMVDVISGKSTTSTLSPLPNLTIGGKVYTPTDGSYVIAGQTLTPGSTRTVTIDGSTYILGLSATPTVLEIDQVGASGKVTATSYETLITGTSSTVVSSATGADKGATGEASSITIAMLSSILASGSLLLAILL